MNKITKHLKCKRCKKDFTLVTRKGRDPQYCSDECRKPTTPTVWNLTCRCCEKEWSMERLNNGGRKPHFCPECYGDASKRRHLRRLKERKRGVRNAYEETMVKWIPAEPLMRVLAHGHIKDEDWAIATSRDRSLLTYMGQKLGINYTAIARYIKPGAKINAYKADEFAIRLRTTPHTYLGDGLLSIGSS